MSNPYHYNHSGIEAIAAIEASMSEMEFLGYLKGNTLKYLWRYQYKGHMTQDLEKALWYLTRLKTKVKAWEDRINVVKGSSLA